MRQITIRLAHNDDKDGWNQFVSKFSDYPCHLYEWKKVLEHVYGYECKYLVAEDQHKIVGVFPVAVIKSKLFGVRILSLPFSDYGGPLLASDEETSSIINSFLERLRPLISRTDYLEVRGLMQCEVETQLQSSLEQGNMSYITFIIDLTLSFDEIWRHRFDKYLRNAIRKAIKNKIEIVQSDFKENLHEFYRTYLLTMKKLGSPPHGMRFFSTCYDFLGDKHVKLFLALKSKKVIGGVFVFLGRYTIYPVYEGIDPKHRNLNPASLLFSRMIEWGCENYRLFDFGRTLFGSGVYSFKRQWGGEEKVTPYYYLGEKIPMQDPREKYASFSELWSRMPISLAKRIGPYIKAGIGY